MSKPSLKFSKWHKWDERSAIKDIKHVGIYLLTLSKKDLSGKKISWPEVSYIGMTNSLGGIISRLGQFHRSICGGVGHSGGITFRNKLGKYPWKNLQLFISACPVKVTVDKKTRTDKDLIKMGWIAFLEYEAMAKYKKVTKKEPLFNKK